MSTVVDSLIVKLEAEIAQHEAKMKQAQQTLDDVKRSTDALSGSEDTLRRSSEELAMSMKKLDDRFKEMDKAVSEFEKQVKDGERVWLSVATASEKYGHEVAKLNKLLEAGAISQETYNRAVKKLSDEFGQGFSDKLTKAGDALTSFGKKATLALTTPILGLGALALNEFAKFDQAMTRTQAIAGIVGEEIFKTRQSILGMSASGDVLQGPAELAKGLEALNRATHDSVQSLQLLPQAANFATVAQLDLKQATDALTEAQRSVGLLSKNAAENLENFARVSDVLVGATTMSQLSVKELSMSLTSMAGSTLRQFNKSIEEGVAVLIEFGRQGITNARAGTMMSRIMLQLSKASRDAADAHKIFGFQVFDTDGKMNHMGNIIKQLTKITAGMNEEMTAATLELLGFDQITQRALIPLFGFGDAIEDNQAKLDKMGGVTKRLSDDIMESFSNQVQVIKNRLVVLGIETAQSLLPTIEKLLGLIEDALNWFNSLSGSAKDLIITITILTATIGPLLIGLGVMITIYGNLVALITSGTVAMGAATVAATALQIAIYSLATLGLAALVAGITVMILKLNDWITGVSQLREETERLIDLNEKLFEVISRRTGGEVGEVRGITDVEKRIKAAEELLAIQKQEEQQQKANTRAMLKLVDAELLRANERLRNAPEDRVSVQQAIDQFDANKGVSGLGPELDQAIADYKQTIALSELANKTQKELEQIIKDGNNELENRDEILKEQQRQMEEGAKRIKEALNAAELAKEQEKAFENASKAFEKHREDLKRVGEQVRQSTLTPAEEYLETIQKLDKLRLAGAITPEVHAIAANEAAEKANKEINKEHNKLIERRNQLLEQTLTPQEKYTRQLEEAQMLFDKGIISVGEFNSIVNHAFEEMQGKAEIDVRFHTSGLDGVEAQSAEAFSRIRATMSLGAPQFRGIRGPDIKTGEVSAFGAAGQAKPQDVREMVNELKEAREQRERTNELLQSILENSPNFVNADLS